MFQKIGVFCIAFLGMTTTMHSQISHQLPKTIYAIGEEITLDDLAVVQHMEWDNFSFRIIDRDQAVKGHLVLNFANLGVPATRYDLDSYTNLEFDKFFFKGYDLYDLHSSQYNDWKNQQRIEKNTAKALAKSYSQFGKLTP